MVVSKWRFDRIATRCHVNCAPTRNARFRDWQLKCRGHRKMMSLATLAGERNQPERKHVAWCIPSAPRPASHAAERAVGQAALHVGTTDSVWLRPLMCATAAGPTTEKPGPAPRFTVSGATLREDACAGPGCVNVNRGAPIYLSGAPRSFTRRAICERGGFLHRGYNPAVGFIRNGAPAASSQTRSTDWRATSGRSADVSNPPKA